MCKNHKIAAQDNPGRSHTFLPLFMWRIILFFLGPQATLCFTCSATCEATPGEGSWYSIPLAIDTPAWPSVTLFEAERSIIHTLRNGTASERWWGNWRLCKTKRMREPVMILSVMNVESFSLVLRNPNYADKTQENKKTFLIITSPHTRKELEHQKYAKNRFKWLISF